MLWQDLVLTGGQLVLIFSLIPSIVSRHKPALMTSLLAVVVLAAFTGVYVTMHLWFTAVTVGVTCFTWVILAYQRHAIDKRELREAGGNAHTVARVEE